MVMDSMNCLMFFPSSYREHLWRSEQSWLNRKEKNGRQRCNSGGIKRLKLIYNR